MGLAKKAADSKVPERLIWVGVLDILVLAGAYALQATGRVSSAVIALAITAIGITTFFGAIWASDSLLKVSTRTALAAAITVVWFASIGALLFVDTAKAGLAESAFQSISLVMGVVVAFYFGASVYQTVAQAGKGGKGGEDGEGDDDQGGGGGESGSDDADEAGFQAPVAKAPVRRVTRSEDVRPTLD